MKRNILGLVMILVLAVSLVAFFSVISDDDEFSLDRLGNDLGLITYREFVPDVSDSCELVLVNHFEKINFEPFISFLARQEKSPPVFS
jgi:hypothetical protein